MSLHVHVVDRGQLIDGAGSLSTFTWILGLRLMSQGLCSKRLNSLSHLTLLLLTYYQ